VQHRAEPAWLIAFRMVQALGGLELNPVAMSIIRNTFTDPRERAQAIGFWGGPRRGDEGGRGGLGGGHGLARRAGE
jgi:MFS family permease